jgi:hypothetical protein
MRNLLAFTDFFSSPPFSISNSPPWPLGDSPPPPGLQSDDGGGDGVEGDNEDDNDDDDNNNDDSLRNQIHHQLKRLVPVQIQVHQVLLLPPAALLSPR